MHAKNADQINLGAINRKQSRDLLRLRHQNKLTYQRGLNSEIRTASGRNVWLCVCRIKKGYARLGEAGFSRAEPIVPGLRMEKMQVEVLATDERKKRG